ncbi:MAG: hypothetical protein V1494_06380 [Candidatus Diapherotrites archaeon]
MDEILVTAIGALGMFFILLAFYINHLKKFKRFTYTYNGIAFLGAALLSFYAFLKSDAIFLALNAIFAFIALYFIAKKMFIKGQLKNLEANISQYGEGSMADAIRETDRMRRR